jgi:EAL domain-containing protein (putative c-di-GMP-specific phosphodiesterase class I)
MKGFKLSIDDFGTGYSSLLQLHRIPFSELKIDGSFVMAMNDDPESLAIVETVILLGDKLGMNIVAEGVETVENLQELIRIKNKNMSDNQILPETPTIRRHSMNLARQGSRICKNQTTMNRKKSLKQITQGFHKRKKTLRLIAQGYHICRPQTAEKITEWFLQKNHKKYSL